MAKLSEQLKALLSEWQDNIREEIDRIAMDNGAKVDEIFALKNAIRENEDKLAAIEKELTTIEGQLRVFVNGVFDIVEDAHNARDYAAYVGSTVDEIDDYVSDDEDDEDEEYEEPITYCDNCGRAISDEDDIVCGYEGEYCCDECRKKVEDEEDENNAPEV